MPPTRRSDTTNNTRAMRIFKERYFNINRKLLMCIGLWPYERKMKRFVLRAVTTGLLTILTIAQLIGVILHYKDIDRLMLNILGGTGLLGMNVKMLRMILAEEKMKALHSRIANNWQHIEDYCERKILEKYSERARTLTICYSAWMMTSGVIAATLPLFSKILDLTRPLESPRPNIYLTGGEYFFDREAQFLPIYFLDYITVMFLASVTTAVDTMYFVSVEHGCALYAIVRSRLLALRLEMRKSSPETEGIDSYEWLRRTIQLHRDALTFTSLLSDSYSTPFLFTLIVGLYVIPLNSCAIIAKLDNPLHLAPYALCLMGLMIHGFLLCYPGQRIIDHQLSLLDAAYYNEWYAVPLRTKKLLLTFMLHCSEPVIITASNLLPVNLEVYFKIMKTAASYITVASSFR